MVTKDTLDEILKDAKRMPDFELEKGKVCYFLACLVSGKGKQFISLWHKTSKKAINVLMKDLKKEAKNHKLERHPHYAKN